MANKQIIRPVKGTVDYYPEEMAIRTWLYQHMRQVSESFGYQEYEGPMLETLDLYAAKSGEEIVEKQSYVFTDRSGDKITLRPELTPTLARLVAQQQQELTFPLRWWSFGPFWRYERPQKGRSREFFQWNIDQIGEPSPEADAELIIIAATFLKDLGLKSGEVQVRINDRVLMDQVTAEIGVAKEKRAEVYTLIDRKPKMKYDAWLLYAQEMGLNNEQIKAIEGLIEDNNLWKKSASLQRILEVVDTYGMSDWVSFDPSIIRGLLYYTGTVFEAWDTAGEFRSLFGGGRYDNLVGEVGGEPVGAVGFAAGNMVIKLMLEKLGRIPNLSRTPAEVFITVFDEDSLTPALELGKDLRLAGLRVTNHLQAEKLGKQFKYADRIGARVALVLGPDELKSKTVVVKDLSSGDQESVPREQVAAAIQKMLEG